MTSQQRKLLVFIDTFQRERGYTPSYAEMAEGIGLTAKSGIHRLMGSLARDGLVKTKPSRARSVEIDRSSLGPFKCPHCGKEIAP